MATQKPKVKPKTELVIKYNEGCNSDKLIFKFLSKIEDALFSEDNMDTVQAKFQIASKPFLESNQLNPKILQDLMESCVNKKTRTFLLYLMVCKQIPIYPINNPDMKINSIIDDIICNAPKLARNILSKNENKAMLRNLFVAIRDTKYDDDFYNTIFDLYEKILHSKGTTQFISEDIKLLIALDHNYDDLYYKIWMLQINKKSIEFEMNLENDIIEYNFVNYKTIKYNADISCISRHVKDMINKKQKHKTGEKPAK